MKASTHPYLDDIIAVKQKSNAHEEQMVPYSKLEAHAFKIVQAEKSHLNKTIEPFKNALLSEGKALPALIGEIKKKSPSKGLIRPDFDPLSIAQAYERAGVNALSILTETHYFEGHPSYLQHIASVSPLPCLRKDFILTAYDVLKSKILGADALLLIATLLTPTQLKALLELAQDLQLEALVEIHHEDDLEKALDAKATLIGINNRDLKTFHVDLAVSERLAPLLPSGKVLVCESGISSKEDLLRMKAVGAHGVLCGEVFMKSPCIETAVRRFKL